MIPDALSENTPYSKLLAFHDETVGKFPVRRAQHRFTSQKSEILDHRLLVDDPDDHLTCISVDPLSTFCRLQLSPDTPPRLEVKNLLDLFDAGNNEALGAHARHAGIQKPWQRIPRVADAVQD
jgi:hypothetical protein